MELTKIEKDIIRAKRLGAKIEVSFYSSERTKGEAISLIALLAPLKEKMVEHKEKGRRWFADYSGDAEFGLTVFYEGENEDE